AARPAASRRGRTPRLGELPHREIARGLPRPAHSDRRTRAHTIAPGCSMTERRGTATSNFGVGKRESHDASAFYERFTPPEVSDDDTVVAPYEIDDPFQLAGARQMDAIKDESVALVVTSPPYFAGKQYEEELERAGVPNSYLEYLDLLTGVFAECAKKLEPGGR